MKKLNKVQIKKLFGFYDIEWEIKNNVNILVGNNGIGKSTILNMIYSLLKSNDTDTLMDNFKFLEKAELIHLDFSDNSSIEFSNNHDILKDKILHSFQNAFPKKLKKEFNKFNEELKKQIVDDFLQYMQKRHDTVNKQLAGFIQGKNMKSSEDLSNNIHVELISTVYLNANSISEIRDNDGTSIRILDFQIKNQLDKLVKLGKEYKETFIESVNQFLAGTEIIMGTNKYASFVEDELQFIFNKTINLNCEDLSSGEKQLIYTILRVVIASSIQDKQVILLLDEPEISLHMSWQRNLIEKLLLINPQMQMIIVTHSPAIVMDGWLNNYIEFEKILKN